LIERQKFFKEIIMAKEKKEPTNSVSFKDTLNLPKTDFPIRANAKEDDPAMIKRWEKENIFSKTFYAHEGSEKYILHDGPPYANGHIHVGHAFNKIEKDITTKSQRMFGKQVPVTPGWDCHGLPIEFKVSQDHPHATPVELKKECRVYARHWVDTQRQEFKDLAVFMDWDNPYLTMDYSYEASIMRAFSDFVAQDYIERKNKAVPWCAHCQTVLASAEIEYQDRKDPSIYVLFGLEPSAAKILFPALIDKPIKLLIWTTTPWTLPLNRAVMVRPGASYVVLDAKDKYLVVGKQLADSVASKLDIEKKVVAEVLSDALVFSKVRATHPFIDGLTVPVIQDMSVSLDEGTAFVHCAPGCGPADYDAGVRNNLEIYSPVGPDGKYTTGIVPSELEGMNVKDAHGWVITKLVEREALAHKGSVTHSYPHCWRCHNGLIFRATKQWFCNLEKNNLREHVLAAIDTIQMLPKGSRNRMYATVEGRLEWCLSRQRVWGVPIPALLCADCDHAYCTPELIEKVAARVEKEGIECWDTLQPSDLVGSDFECPMCKSLNWKKEQDTLDVWFDSGVSHYAVLKNNKKLAFPADIYIEAQDQYRGWFQSSLLTSMVLEQSPCMKTILTHGFTVDEKGRKMSKSIGNVVSPAQMIEKLGVDGLRLWVASVDCSGDIVVSDTSMNNAQEVFRKIRNTARFLLSNLYDFDFEQDAIALDQLRAIDVYALQRLFEVNREVIKFYAQHDYTAIFHALANYCAVDLSAFYLDIIKDRLYVEKADGLNRRSAQTVCWYILDTLTHLLAPILSVTAEQLSDNYQKNKKESIHLQTFKVVPNPWEILGMEKTEGQVPLAFSKLPVSHVLENITKTGYMIKQEECWQVALLARSALLKAIEAKREVGLIKHSLEARVALFIDPEHETLRLLLDLLNNLHDQTPQDFLREFLIVSQVELATEKDGLEATILSGLYASVTTARGVKCPRCWQWEETKHPQGLCTRCAAIVDKKS
jgi:isoleucyl-tRNA synthetase